MARKTMMGQLNMFDFYSSTDVGEVEMVSLMPSFEDESEVEVLPEPEVSPEVILEPIKMSQDVVMSRIYEINGERIEVAYINYNKVRVTKENEIPVIHEFNSSKEAVDYYVGYMQQLEPHK